MRKFWFLLLFLLITSSMVQIVASQPKDIEKQLRQFRVNRNLYFNYDLYQFAAHKPGKTRLSIVVSMVNDLLQFVKKSDSLYVADFEITYTITELSNQLISDKTFRRSISVNHFKETNSKVKYHSYYYGLDLEPGKYQLLLELTDLDIRKSLTRKKEFVIQSVDTYLLEISDPLITSEIIEDPINHLETLVEIDNKNSFEEFIENSQILTPILIGDKYHYQTNTLFSIYQEFYQQPNQDSLSVRYQLINNTQETVWQSKETFFSTNQHHFQNTIQINPSEYAPGLYKLEVLADNGGENLYKEFRIYFNRKMTAMEKHPVEIDEFGPMGYILTKQEFEYFASYEKSTRDSLIEEFWHERDPTRNTRKNELREEFIHRVQFANQNFVSLLTGRQGWETDQGRAYILNGPPSEIFHPSVENEEYQHEIWVYDNPSLNLRFVFVFKADKGEYELLSKG